MNLLKSISVISLCLAIMAGCSKFDSPGKPITDQNVQNMEALRAKKTKDHNELDAIDITEEKYLGGGIKVEKSKVLNLPQFFNKQVAEVSTQSYDFFEAIAVVQKHVPCDIDVTPQSESAAVKKIVLRYQGSVKGLLDRITTHFNLFWEFENSQISVFRVKTESYKVFASVGKVESTIEMNNSSTSSSGSGSGVSGETTEGKGVQRSKIVSNVDLWADIETDLKNIISSDGSITVNRAAGFVSVVDTPWVHKSVKQYIEDLNSELARQSAITVKVYNLDIDDETDHSFNADAVFTNISEDYSLSLKTIAQSAADAVTSGAFSGAILDTATGSFGKFKGSQFVLEALKTYGKVSLVTTASGICLNNQDMPIQNVTNKGYPAESSTSSTNYNTTNALIPGNLTTGFSMIVTPHILDNNKIILQYSVSLSNLDRMNEFTSGDSKIQTPDYSSRSFTQRVALESGSTLLLAGFETDSNVDEQTYKLWGLENKGSRKRSMIVILITVNNVEGAKG